MTKGARREKKRENLGRKWKAFNREAYGLCGSKWLTRRTIVFILFGTCAVYVPPHSFTRPRSADRIQIHFFSAALVSYSPLSSRACLASPSMHRILFSRRQARGTHPSRQSLAAFPPTFLSLPSSRFKSTLTPTFCLSFLTPWMPRCTISTHSIWSERVT
jgi:hypothetical protein